jgi:hypothetical protein
MGLLDRIHQRVARERLGERFDAGIAVAIEGFDRGGMDALEQDELEAVLLDG